jgi:thioredoxin reductase (NADPH)
VDAPIHTDALVVGAGPTGLFQAFQLGLLDIRCHLVDSLSAVGGQCVALYPDKPIYDIPAVPVCTGRELTQRLLQQTEPFQPTFHLAQQVSTVAPLGGAANEGGFDVTTSAGTRFVARTIFIAGGVGSFMPRQLSLDGMARFARNQLFYTGDALPCAAGAHVVVMGDDDAALDYALSLADATADRAASVTLMHRRDAFTAAPATVDRMRAACAAGRMRFVAGQVIGFEHTADRLTHLTLSGPDGHATSLPTDLVVVLWGLAPKLGPIADWGLQLARKQVVVDTEKFETSAPRIFAVGDVNTYPGKKKLILCGFHEATLAAYAAAAYVFPDRTVQVQYTTTSTRLHKLLGLATQQ